MLKEYKVFVRQNSDKSIDYLIKKYKNIMNHSSDDKVLYYAMIFDSRTLKNYMVFCDKATKLYNIDNSYTTKSKEIIKGVIDTTPFVDKNGEVKTENKAQPV